MLFESTMSMFMMSQKKATEYYKKIQIQTASHEKIICMLHERCYELMQKALNSKSVFERHEYICKAQNILVQLQKSLINTDSVSQGLFYIYDFVYLLLQKERQNQSLGSAIRVFNKIQDTFITIAHIKTI